MTLPVRSYKCKHFECFDIGDLCEKNVITFLNRKRGKPKSQSKNEKEKVCPLCGIKI